MINQKPHLVGSAHPTESGLYIGPPAPGPWNMAVDEAMLIDAVQNGVATLRFYEWSEPTLSLGYFQRYEDRHKHAASRECAVVRRQTGGGAILHDRELTYSLALPANHPLARQSEKLYAAVHEAFIAALTPMIANRVARWSMERHDQQSSRPPCDEPFLCFQRRAGGDVLLVSPNADTDAGSGTVSPPPDGWKILGSAQRRRRGAILQHGSLLLRTSPAAPELAGLGDLTGLDVAIEEVSHRLGHGLKNALDMPILPAELPPNLESKAGELANNKYGSAAWTKRR